MKDCILVTDIESTGFSHEYDFILEIGIVSLNIKTGEIIPLVNECVWKKGITKEVIEHSWIVKNSSLTVEDIWYGNRIDKIKNLIQTIIDHYPLGMTAYNSSFDFRMLKHYNFTFKELPCPMQILTDILKINKPNFRGGYKYPSVTESYNHFFPNEDYVEEHRALSDAIDEAKIIWEMIKQGIYKIE